MRMTWARRGSNYTACRDVGNLRDGTLSALLDSFMELACVGPYASTFVGITMAECCCTRVREIRNSRDTSGPAKEVRVFAQHGDEVLNRSAN